MKRRSRLRPKTKPQLPIPTAASTTRPLVLLVSILTGFLLVGIKLFHWQLIQADSLELNAEEQYLKTIQSSGQRGTLYTQEGLALVTNQEVYRLFAHPHLIEVEPNEAAALLTEALLAVPEPIHTSRELTHAALEAEFATQLSKDTKWVGLLTGLTKGHKEALEELGLYGIGFDPYFERFYPEASLAAHIVGFVGKTSSGEDTGYFGIEGALEAELKARTSEKTIATDALGRELFPTYENGEILSGRDIYLTIRRDIQFLAESALKAGVERYGAQAGEIIILEPNTGRVLALATYPTYDPGHFSSYEPSLYKNPTLTALYEPGSTFKVLTTAAGIDAGVISPDTQCTRCAGPRRIDKYTIKTWNDTYTANITMRNGLAKSDNTAMIYITDLLGKDTFLEYLKAFDIGEPIGLELQEDQKTPFPQKVGPVELATLSFGQGILTNSFQIAKAVNAIASDGLLIQPSIIEKTYDPATDETLHSQPKVIRRAISPESAQTITEMMIYSATQGKTDQSDQPYRYAAKSGTSQIAVRGGYDENKTIASYVGFGPADDPEFTMMVKLVEPSSSEWGAETAAPLWYSIAERVRIALRSKT